jgi:branched-subunit amino acid ABC-type transport system permease component
VNLETVVTELVGILTDASTLFVVSAGLTLIFGALRLINMAHGSLFMIGALATSTVVAAVGAGSAGFWTALILCPVGVAVLGAGVEIGVLRRIHGREHLTQLLATFALYLVFADLCQRLWGTADRTVAPPAAVSGRFLLAGATVPEYNLVVIGLALLVGAGLWLMLRKSALGWRIRAAVEDPESLAAGGTNLSLLRTGVFALAAGLAGLGGAAIAPLESVGPGLDTQIIVAAFIVTVVGGLGSVLGAALGALVIATAETLGTLWAPTYASSMGYLVMILVLAVRPWGLFGTPER